MYISSSSEIRNFKLQLFCDCTGRFVSDLFRNHIVGFPKRRFIFYIIFHLFIFSFLTKIKKSLKDFEQRQVILGHPGALHSVTYIHRDE